MWFCFIYNYRNELLQWLISFDKVSTCLLKSTKRKKSTKDLQNSSDMYDLHLSGGILFLDRLSVRCTIVMLTEWLERRLPVCPLKRLNTRLGTIVHIVESMC